MVNQGSATQTLHVVRIIRIAASVMAGLLMAIAILAIWRRSIGAFRVPLPIATYFCIGLMIMIPAAALRSWWRFIARPSKQLLPLESIWTFYTPTLSILVILATISVPQTPAIGIVVASLFFFLCETMVHWPSRHLAYGNQPGFEPVDNAIKPDLDDRVESLPASENEEQETTTPSADSPALREIESQPEQGVSQQLIRCRTEDGRDCLKGWIRVDIPAGRRAQSVHLAFCPAFHQTPKIEIHPEGEGSSRRIKTVQCLPYGAHLEVKMAHPSPMDETLTLHFQALGEK